MRARLRVLLCFLTLAQAVTGCESEWTIRSVEVLPRTFTAGSDEVLYVRVEVEPGEASLEPGIIEISPLSLNGGLVADLYESEWLTLFDSGTWGDSVARDYVFERRGVHPFLETVVPGTYVLRFGAPPGENPAQTAEVEIMILPPP